MPFEYFEISQFKCDHCGRELRSGEHPLIWAPMEEVGERENQQLVCDICERELAQRIHELLGDEDER